MKYTKGQQVIVTDHFNVRSTKRVWADSGDYVLITSDRGYKLLKKDERAIFPIAFDKRYVRLAS